MNKPTFYKKLLLTYSSIIIVYTFFAVLMFLVITKNFNDKQWHSRNHIYIEQIGDTVDSTLEVAVGIMQQLLGNGDVVQFVTQEKINYYNLTNIYNQIKENITPFGQLGVFVAVGKNSADQIISSEGTLNEGSFFSKMKFPFGNKEELYSYMDNFRDDGFVTVRSNSDYYGHENDFITLIRKQSFSNNNEMIAYLSFMEKIIIPSVTQEQEGALLILSDHNIVSFNSNKVAADDAHKLIPQLIKMDDQVSYKLDGYTAYIVSSKIVDWKYVYLVPSIINRRLTTQILVESSLTCLILMLFGSLIAFFITKKTYAPIYKIMKYFKDESDQDLNNEFDIIEKASLNMKQANERLKEIIISESASLKNKFLRDLLYGLIPNNVMEDKLHKHKLKSYCKKVVTLILEYDDLTDLQQTYSEESFYAIRMQISNIIKDALISIPNYEIIELDFKRIVIIVNQEDAKKVIEIMQMILTNIESEHFIGMTGAVGNSVESIKSISYSFRDALKTLEYRSLAPNKKLLSNEDISEVIQYNYYYPLEQEQNLITYVLQGKTEETKMLLNHLLSENFESRNLSIENKSLLTFAIVGTVNRLINQLNKSIEEVFGEGFMIYLELKSITKENDFRDKVVELFDTLLDTVTSSQTDHKDKKLSDRIREYINKNYMLDISLLDIADKFSITPAYVSMLFKKEHGYNFKDYLNMYRISRSKEIMNEDPGIKNADLARIIGYNSVNTFLRLFKKYEGVSPGKYRESKRRD